MKKIILNCWFSKIINSILKNQFRWCSILTSQCELVPENNCQTVTRLVPELVPRCLPFLYPFSLYPYSLYSLSTSFFLFVPMYLHFPFSARASSQVLAFSSYVIVPNLPLPLHDTKTWHAWCPSWFLGSCLFLLVLKLAFFSSEQFQVLAFSL